MDAHQSSAQQAHAHATHLTPSTHATQDPRPIYLQIAAELRDSIGSGTLPEETRAPSIHELARYHSVNPTTSSKALTTLVDEGLLEKRRGLGMFVVPGARERVVRRRREAFAEQFLGPLIGEAIAIGITRAELQQLLDSRWTATIPGHAEADSSLTNNAPQETTPPAANSDEKDH